MNREEAQSAIKSLYSEAFNLSPSQLITLFEIDLSGIGFDRGVISQNEINSQYNVTFRFHNSVKLTNSSIFFNKKEYIAAPINAEGFEVNTKGVSATPKLSLTVSDDGIPHLTMLKERLLQLGDLTGAKVTRIRTFAKFLDAENFFGTTVPDEFSPNPNSAFPKDVFYIERKSLENKNVIEFELSSLIDIEGLKLPGRIVTSNICTHQYRGASCMYEYNSRRNTIEHGEEGESTLPEEAPPVATQFNEYISDLLSGIAIIDFGEFDKNRTYTSGNFVFVEHNSIKYYFVCKKENTQLSPPNLQAWIPDQCSKSLNGCEIRYSVDGSAQGNITKGNLPIGTFLSVNRFK